MKFFSFLFSLLIILPFVARASTVDLSMVQSGVTFSKDTLISGDTVRIYVSVKNVGDVDTSGYVSFFQGSLPIGDSQVISLRAEGYPEEVYVDFVVPSGAFNIRAEIRGTDPADSNESNNTVITQLFTPVLDDDRDGIENSKDNCPSVENANQADNDLDGLGDVCDDDDDNDGVTDDVEKEIGTDPKNSDTDGDGLTDNVDPHPTVPESQIPVEKPAEVVTQPVVETPAAVTPSTETESGVDKLLNIIAPEETASEVVSTASPNAVFTYKKINWNTYLFEAQLPMADGYVVAWNFGDGVTSSKETVEHTFSKSGDYTITISVTGPDGQIAEDAATIHVPFFSLENRLVQFVITLLVLLLIFLSFSFRRVGRSGGHSSRIKKPTASSGSVKISVRQDNSDLE